MNKNNYEAIVRYNQERNLTKYDEQKEVGFIIEEIDEYYKAMSAYNKDQFVTNFGMVDALCDILVFTIGSLFKQGVDYGTYYTGHKQDTIVGTILDIAYNLHNLANTISYCEGLLIDMGYDPDLCMEQVIQHIDSRKGELNSVSGKFEKFTDKAHTDLWYEPQYNLAKLKKDKHDY